jgi:hypothetical protein
MVHLNLRYSYKTTVSHVGMKNSLVLVTNHPPNNSKRKKEAVVLPRMTLLLLVVRNGIYHITDRT